MMLRNESGLLRLAPVSMSEDLPMAELAELRLVQREGASVRRSPRRRKLAKMSGAREEK